jgi:hypothetical protein
VCLRACVLFGDEEAGDDEVGGVHGLLSRRIIFVPVCVCVCVCVRVCVCGCVSMCVYTYLCVHKAKCQSWRL